MLVLGISLTAASRCAPQPEPLPAIRVTPIPQVAPWLVCDSVWIRVSSDTAETAVWSGPYPPRAKTGCSIPSL